MNEQQARLVGCLRSVTLRLLVLEGMRTWLKEVFAELETSPAAFLAKLDAGPQDEPYAALIEKLRQRKDWDWE